MVEGTGVRSGSTAARVRILLRRFAGRTKLRLSAPLLWVGLGGARTVGAPDLLQALCTFTIPADFSADSVHGWQSW